MKKIQNLFKPVIIFLAYGFAVGSEGMAGGLANPMLAINVGIWDRVSYGYIYRPNADDPSNQTRYDYDKLGHYMWVYTMAPIAAGLVAGAMSHWHKKQSSLPEKIAM